MTEKEVENIAHLARVNLSQEECSHFVDKISHILDSFEVIRSVKVDDEVELLQPRKRDDLREDACLGGNAQEKALKNAPQAHEGHFRVPAIL
jgi:aspartyl-tRNA(Asn)/glutamyl-tRNA(Gln) amidotransferase subunit C